MPLVAVGSVRMHVRSRKPLQDVLTAVRLGQTLADCGLALLPNAEAHLRARSRLAQIYPPELLANTLMVASRCHFSLDELHYHYPQEAVLPGLTPAQTLRQLTLQGAARRYPQGMPELVHTQLDHELALIAELAYEMYFLYRARHRRLCAQPRYFVPGTGFSGQFGGVLLPGRDRGGPGARQPAV